jgi:hypothetical protein
MSGTTKSMFLAAGIWSAVVSEARHRFGFRANGQASQLRAFWLSSEPKRRRRCALLAHSKNSEILEDTSE